MPATLVQSKTALADMTTNLSLTLDSTTVVGNLLVMAIHYNPDTAAIGGLTKPSNWLRAVGEVEDLLEGQQLGLGTESRNQGRQHGELT